MGIYARIRDIKEKFREKQYSNKYKAAVDEHNRLIRERAKAERLGEIQKQNIESRKAIEAQKQYAPKPLPNRIMASIQGLRKDMPKPKQGKNKIKSMFFQSKPGPFTSMGSAKPGFYEMGRK